MTEIFKTKEELRHFIFKKTPILMKSQRSKYTLIDVFSRNNSMFIVVDALTDALWEKLNNK
jgi:hypothetical protein